MAPTNSTTTIVPPRMTMLRDAARRSPRYGTPQAHLQRGQGARECSVNMVEPSTVAPWTHADCTAEQRGSGSAAKRRRTPWPRTNRLTGLAGATLVGFLLLPYALPVGIIAWMLGSAIALAALAALILAAVAMVVLAAVVASAGAIVLPATAVYLLTLGFLGTMAILTAQRALNWYQSLRTRAAEGRARRRERGTHRAASSALLASQVSRSLGARHASLATSA